MDDSDQLQTSKFKLQTKERADAGHHSLQIEEDDKHQVHSFEV
jgi:hypothetical protein